MQTETFVHDPYLRFLDGVLPTPGQSAFNVFSRQPGPHISRTFETGWMAGTKFETLGVPSGWILTKGCAAAVCGDGLVRHCCPGYGLSRFCGFIESMLTIWQSLLRDCIAYRETNDKSEIINIDFSSEIMEFSKLINDQEFGQALAENVKITLADMKRNVHIQGALTAMVLKIKSNFAP